MSKDSLETAETFVAFGIIKAHYMGRFEILLLLTLNGNSAVSPSRSNLHCYLWFIPRYVYKLRVSIGSNRIHSGSATLGVCLIKLILSEDVGTLMAAEVSL